MKKNRVLEREKISQIGPTVWPAIANIYNIYKYIYERRA